jgi:acyl-CoA thioester hydrolase
MRAAGRYNRGTMPQTFMHRLRVRYGECDPQGVVFNANYVAYLDVVFTELWRAALGRYQDLVDSGIDTVVAEVRVRYVGSAGFDDQIEFEVRLVHLGSTSMVTEVDATVGERPIVSARLRHVFIDAASKAKAEMPPHVHEALAPYLHERDAVDEKQ